MIPLILTCCHTSAWAAVDQEILLTDDSVLPDKPDKIEHSGFHPVRLNREKENKENKVSVHSHIFLFIHNRLESQIRHDDTVNINIWKSEFIG